MAASAGTRKRTRGSVEKLPSGALRVRVYAGADPLTGRSLYLTESVPGGPTAARDAEKARTRLLNRVDERRNPTTRATLNQLFDKWLDVSSIEASTRRSYLVKLDCHIRPVLGDTAIAKVTPETLETFYAALRRCRDRCGGNRRPSHHARGAHVCDERCEVHVCRPLAPATVRQIHAILRAAMERAVKWGWIPTNPAARATPPALPKPNPTPPTVDEASRIMAVAWKDPDWGMLVWLAMITGARRGELCALRWECLDLATGVLEIRSSLDQNGTRVEEKSTKTHQQRRIALDAQTVGLLGEYRARRVDEAGLLGVELPADSWMFSRAPDSSIALRPDSVGQRYARMCARIGIDTHLHELRHYSATELISAGVDVRTVAGRLGHSGGGTTTLRVYSAWRSEADQRAALQVAVRMPTLPTRALVGAAVIPVLDDPDASPYQRIAADLRAAISCRALRSGEFLPTLKELTRRYEVAESTALRAVTLLVEAGLVSAARGKRTIVV